MKFRIRESTHSKDLTVLVIGAITIPMGDKAKINGKTYKIKYKSSNASLFVEYGKEEVKNRIYLEGLHNFKEGDEVELI